MKNTVMHQLQALFAVSLAAMLLSANSWARDLPDFTVLAEQNSPAVVNISTQQKSQLSQSMPEGFSMPEMPEDSPFNELFKHFFGEGMEEFGERESQSLGSGLVISPDGYILTNHHVVSDADEIQVRFSDRRTYDAKVIGSDKGSDVALIKIDATDLPTVKIGKSSDLKVGEWVLAIGSPFGFDHTVTAGIVSAKGRSLPSENYVPFIQTDVAVNPGNSGGPLFNMAGEVIGVNSQIYSRSGGYQGLSFAIPIEVAMNVERQIVTNGKVQRGKLGISIQEVNQALADSFGLKKPAGALVGSVEKGSPAASAGLEPGDVILGINGKELSSSAELPAIVSAMMPGTEARLDVWRKGSTRQIEVKVGQFSDEKVASNDQPEAAKGRLGVVVRPLNAEEKRRAEVDNGVVVENVAGAAAKAGIKTGDIVLSVNGETITSTEQLRNIVTKAEKRIAVLVDRGNSRIFIPVDLG
jgi:serine protease Do